MFFQNEGFQMKTARLFVSLMFVFFSITALFSYDRIVLIEEFTSATCPPCVQASQNMNAVVDPGNGIISIRYHMDWPAPNDPFNVHNYSDNMSRRSYYAVTGIPFAAICGTTTLNPNDMAALQNAINSWKGQPSPMLITVEEDRSNPQNVQVTVRVTSDQAYSGVTLRVAVLARYVELPDLPQTLPNSNGETEFYDAMLKMLPNASGTVFDIGQGETKTFTFNYAMGSGELWPEGQIYVTAFVQNDQTKEVYQAGTNIVEYGVELQATMEYLRVDPNDEVSTQIQITNPYQDQDMDVDLLIDETMSIIPTGWNVSIDQPTLSLPAGQSATVTLTIAAGAKAGYARVVLKSKPKIADGIARVDRIAIRCLSNATRYIVYPFLGWGAAPAEALLALPDYGDYTTLMPEISPQILSAYPLEDFDAAIIFIDYFNRGVLSANVFDAIAIPLRNGLTAAIQAGKGVWIAAELDVLFAWHSTYGSSHAQNFWRNVVGIESGGNPVLRVQTNSSGQITGVIPFSVQGESGDPVGNGINLQFNTMPNWQSVPFVIYTENVQVVATDAVTVFRYDDNSVAGIRREDAQTGGRLVYQGFPIFGTMNITGMANLMQQVMVWITGGQTAPKPPTISAPAEVNFGVVPVGQTKVETFTVGNAGDEPLEITEMQLYDDAQVYQILNLPALPLTLQPGESIELQVEFAPTSADEFIAMLLIISNDPNNNPYSVVLNGRGQEATGVAFRSGEQSSISLRKVSNEEILVSWTDGAGATIEVRDITGRLVESTALSPGQFQWSWNVQHLPSGIYLLHVQTNGKEEIFTIQLTR